MWKEGPTPEEITEGKGAELVPLTQSKARAIVQHGLSRLHSETRKELALAHNGSLDHQAEFDQCVIVKKRLVQACATAWDYETALKNNLELAP